MVVAKRVLVADDDQPIRRFIRAVLEREGLLVEEAADGRQALAKIRHDGYDAIVLDLMMPLVSGYDVLAEITRERPNSKCVVIISAAAAREIEQADPSIVRAKLRKPFDIQDLVAAVHSCTD